MGKTIDKHIREHIKNLILKSDSKPKDISKLVILADKFYKDNKSAFDKAKVNLYARKVMMSNFILFVVQFETLCVKAYRPFGSGSTADDIISLYSKVQIDKVINETNIKSLK